MNEKEFRLKVLEVAQSEIGKGETEGNNAGPDVMKYLSIFDIKDPQSWCAAFVAWCVYEAGESFCEWSMNEAMDFVRRFADIFSPSAKATFNNFKKLGWLVDEPEPGDLIFFWREDSKSWKGHVGIVESFNQSEWPDVVSREITPYSVATIEGNKGKFPAKVRVYHYQDPVPQLLGYGRLFGK